MIPKKIHYCWFGMNPLPDDVRRCIVSWQKHCPDYEIIQWNETNFDVNYHPFMESAYEAKAWAFVSDYARLKIIYDEGGIYLDTDVELLKSLDIILDNKCYVAVQQCGHYIATGLGFGAEKSHPMIKAMLGKYNGINFSLINRHKLACPYLNTEAFKDRGYKCQRELQIFQNVYIYPPRYFDPIAPGDSKNLMCEDTISIHHYSASWTSNVQRLKRRLIRAIGQDKVNKLKSWLKVRK